MFIQKATLRIYYSQLRVEMQFYMSMRNKIYVYRCILSVKSVNYLLILHRTPEYSVIEEPCYYKLYSEYMNL